MLMFLNGRLRRVMRSSALPIAMLFVIIVLSSCLCAVWLLANGQNVSGSGRCVTIVRVLLSEVQGMIGRMGLKTLRLVSGLVVLAMTIGGSSWCVGLGVVLSSGRSAVFRVAVLLT